MTGVRLNSEKKLECDGFKLKVGTTNKTNPIVIYVEGRGFISPSEEKEKEDYSKDISEIKHVFKTSISDKLHENKHFDNKFIVDFQIASSGIAVKKKSFLSFQYLLRQNEENVKKLIDIKNTYSNMFISIADELRDVIVEKGYVLSKTKK